MNEAVASERWLDSDAMRAHAVDFRWREELLSFEVDVHDVVHQPRWQARESVKAER